MGDPIYVDPDKVSNSDYHFDAFEDWANDNGVGPLEHKEDWSLWWDCWVQAIHYAALAATPETPEEE